MIFDRTQADVSEAVEIRDEKIKKGIELSEDDINILERGTMTINTLNRIEERQETLKNLFNDMGYWNALTTNKSWDLTQIFDESEFQRIIDNTNILREAFFVYASTPKTPPVSYHWRNINDLEKILHDLDLMISDVKSHYRECGTFESGE